MAYSSAGGDPQGSPIFATTQWSLIVTAREESTPGAAEALESLCKQYWYPVYAFLRRLGCSSADAQDLTQELFTRLITRRNLDILDPARGRFRSFLMTAAKRLMLSGKDHQAAQKRGGGQVLSLDALDPEARYAAESAGAEQPERVFDRRWAETLVARAYQLLETEAVDGGDGGRFEQLKPYLQTHRDLAGLDEVARQLGITEAGAKTAVHRLRKRFAAIFRQEIGRTVDDPAEIGDELRYLLSALS